MRTHLTGIRTKTECGRGGLIVKTTGRVEEVTCDDCKASTRFKRMSPPENRGGIMTSGSL